jgi:hypothetical protein
MDVLHFLKTQHDLLRTALARVEQDDGVKARRLHIDGLARELATQLVIEKDYLYPELIGLFPGSDTVVANGLASGALINRRIKVLVKLIAKTAAEQDGYDKRLAELKDSLLKHCEQQEQILMPKLRSLIRTEDREDLGQVFVEAKQDLVAGKPQAAQAAPSRKRA